MSKISGLEYPYNLMAAVNKEPLTWIMKPENIEALEEVISSRLTEREQKAINLYYVSKMTLGDVGKEFGLTRERIRQILAKAIIKISQPQYFNYICQGIHTVSDIEEKNNKLIEREKYLALEAASLQQYRSLLEIRQHKIELIMEKYGIPKNIFEISDEQFIKEVGNFNYLHAPLENLNLSVRSFNCLYRAGINTIDGLIDFLREKGPKGLIKIRNLGRASYYEILEKVNKYIGFEMFKSEVDMCEY